MSFQRLIQILLLLCATAVLSTGCQKDTAETTPEPTPQAQETPEEAPAQAEVSDKAEKAPKKFESARNSAAALRDRFQQEAEATITLDNAESTLSQIERDIDKELADLESAPTP